MRTDTGGKRRYVAAGKPVGGKATARRTGAVTPLPNGRGGQRMGAAGRTGDKLIDVPAVLKYYQDNPAEAVKAYAKSVLDPLGARDTADSLREGNYAAAGLAAAGALPIPGAKVASVAGKVAKVARVAKTAERVAETASKAGKAARTASRGARTAKSDYTIADAIGADQAAALRKAVAGRKPSIPKAPVRANYPTQAKYDAAWKRYAMSVKRYNEHPSTAEADRLTVVSRDAGKGPAATDPRGKTAKAVDKDVAKQTARTSDAEKATIDAGARATKRTPRKPTVKLGDQRSPVLGSGEPKARATRTRSKTKAMPTSAKPNTAAIERNADVIDRFAQKRANRPGTGPGEGNATQLASDFRQRLSDVRAARNRGDLPSYEVQEKIGVGTTPPKPAVRPSTPTPLQLQRSRVNTARFERAGQKGWEPEGTPADAKPQMKFSEKPATKTQISKWVKQYAPGTNPMRKNPDGSWPSLSAYPGRIAEQILQARNAALEPGQRVERAVGRLMRDSQHNPVSVNRPNQGRAPRETTNPRVPDEAPLTGADRALADLGKKLPTDEGRIVTKAPTIIRKPLPKRTPRPATPAAEAPKAAAKRVSAKPAAPKPAPKPAAPAAEPAAKPASTPMTKTSELPPERRQALLEQYKALEAKGIIGKGDAERIMAGKEPKSYKGVKQASAKKATPKPTSEPKAPKAKDTSTATDAEPTPKANQPKAPKGGSESKSNVTPISEAKSAKKAAKKPSTKESKKAAKEPSTKKPSTKKPSAKKGKKADSESVASLAARVPAMKKKYLAMTGAAGVGIALTAKYGPKQAPVSADTAEPADLPATPKPRPKFYRDKYGRKISAAEYDRRKAWRNRQGTMTGAELARSTEQELARRRRYRANLGKKAYGRAAAKVTRNSDVPRGVSVATWRGMTPGEKRRYKRNS